MFFPFRENKKEIMDDYSIIDDRMFDALKELEVINKYLGGVNITREGINLLVKGRANKKRISILDVGAGYSDVLIKNSNNKMNIIHLDINPGIMKKLRTRNVYANCICGDASTICLRQKSIDIVHLSLFLHHISDRNLKGIFSDLLGIARVGIIINDLRRNVLAYMGIKLLTSIFSKSEMVRNDGPLSVKKGFTKKEIETLLSSFEVEYVIKRKWAFRWLVCVYL